MEKKNRRKQAIDEHYEALAREEIRTREDAGTITRSLGYSLEELAALPREADLGLGCGNPHQMAKPREGEEVLDLGSGRGLDCFIAARAVGSSGRVVGVDALASMVEKAQAVALKHGYTQCRFIQGEIEAIPCQSNSFDLVMSNCVINLSDDKEAVYNEIFRVLKPGGRVAVSDITAKQSLPAEWVADPHMAKT